jgi:hypothetical protein
MYALFVKISGTWSFAGFQQHEELVTEFEESVAKDIDLTSDAEVRTEAFKVVDLDAPSPVPSDFQKDNPSVRLV